MISKWIIKAIVQKFISVLPWRERINYLFQRYATKAVILDDIHFGYKMEHARDHLNFLSKCGKFSDDNLVLELGTGWYPIIPICFYLKDAGKVYSVDIQSWIRKKTQIQAIEKILEWENKGSLEKYLGAINRQKLKNLKDVVNHPENYTFSSINSMIGLNISLMDARKTHFDDGYFDFICSNNTFEHIPPVILRSILKEFKRIIKPTGGMSHFIDMSDHFAHFDTKITIYNFLKYSKVAWSWIDNKIQPQNRLRFIEFMRMYDQLGIPVSATEIRKGNLEELSKVKIHNELSEFTPIELAVSHGYIFSKMD